jgi:ATP-dependent Clp protease ATP-binding subunit ClpC
MEPGRGVVGSLFDKYTERAKRVLMFAQEESRRLNHDYIGTEHLLLGLVQDSWSTGSRVLSDMGIGQAKVRSAVQFMVGREENVEPEERDRDSRLSLTEGAQKALKLAADEARRDGHRQVGTGHLLLGLAREGEGLAASELLSLGVNVQRFRQQVRQAVSQGEAS